MINKGNKKGAGPTPRPKQKSKSKSKPKTKAKLIDISKIVNKSTSAKPKPKSNNITNNLSKIKSKDLSSTLLLKRQTISRCKSRPKSSLSATFKKIPTSQLEYRININDLVTQEDMIIISEYNELQTLPTLNKNYQKKNMKRQKNEEEAATLIQKTWRGFKTRKLVKYYINLYQKIDNHCSAKFKSKETTKKKPKLQNKNHSKQQSSLLKPFENQGQQQSRYQININMSINISPVQQYSSFYSDQECHKSEDGITVKSISIRSFNEIQNKTNINALYSPVSDSLMRVTEMQLDLLQSQQKQQMDNLQSKFNRKKIQKKVYEIKKVKILKLFQQQKQKLKKSRSQINFGFLRIDLNKVHSDPMKINNKKNHSEQKLSVLKYNIQNTLKSQEDDVLSLDYNFSYQKQKQITKEKQQITHQKQKHKSETTNRKPLKPFVASFLQDDIDQINTEEIQNISMESLEAEQTRQKVDQIQEIIYSRLIDQLVVELYLNPSVSSQLSSFFDLTHISKFQKLDNQEISKFIDIMFTRFKPSDEDVLKRLNQKINPTAEQLLRILRNQGGDMDDEFYQLVIPEKNFKQFREWRDNQNKDSKLYGKKANKIIVLIPDLPPEQKIKMELKQKQYLQKKIRLEKFQKDLQAMYLKSVFNCLNQSIVQTKCSYSPINGRSTIGPGQLRVSLLDSNTEVSLSQIPVILAKSKKTVMRNFRYSCPNLDISNYDSVYRFQEILMKQLHQEIEHSEHRWNSFFDQHLQIAIEIYTAVLQQLMTEAVREMYWKVWKR